MREHYLKLETEENFDYETRYGVTKLGNMEKY